MHLHFPIALTVVAALLWGCGSDSGAGEHTTCAPDLSIPSEDCTFTAPNRALNILSPQDLEPLCASTCTRFDGLLAFDGIEGMTDMRALSRLREINGVFTLGGRQSYLVSLRGMEGIERMRSIRVQRTERLTSLEGLNNLKESGAIVLLGNQVLRDLALPKLERIDGALSTADNPELAQCEVDALAARVEIEVGVNSSNNGGTCMR